MKMIKGILVKDQSEEWGHRVNVNTRLRFLVLFRFLSDVSLEDIAIQIEEAEIEAFYIGFREANRQTVVEIGEVDDTDWKRGYEKCRQEFIDGKLIVPTPDGVREDFIKEGYDRGYDKGYDRGYTDGLENKVHEEEDKREIQF